jgi:hypothetical protein
LGEVWWWRLILSRCWTVVPIVVDSAVEISIFFFGGGDGISGSSDVLTEMAVLVFESCDRVVDSSDSGT